MHSMPHKLENRTAFATCAVPFVPMSEVCGNASTFRDPAIRIAALARPRMLAIRRHSCRAAGFLRSLAPPAAHRAWQVICFPDRVNFAFRH